MLFMGLFFGYGFVYLSLHSNQKYKLSLSLRWKNVYDLGKVVKNVIPGKNDTEKRKDEVSTRKILENPIGKSSKPKRG